MWPCMQAPFSSYNRESVERQLPVATQQLLPSLVRSLHLPENLIPLAIDLIACSHTNEYITISHSLLQIGLIPVFSNTGRRWATKCSFEQKVRLIHQFEESIRAPCWESEPKNPTHVDGFCWFRLTVGHMVLSRMRSWRGGIARACEIRVSHGTFVWFELVWQLRLKRRQETSKAIAGGRLDNGGALLATAEWGLPIAARGHCQRHGTQAVSSHNDNPSLVFYAYSSKRLLQTLNLSVTLFRK